MPISHAQKIVLAGNPNCGKSLLFSRLTGVGVVSANYSGTTVAHKVGRFKYLDREYEVLDLPGIYSLEPFSTADEAAVRLIESSDILVDVVDATTLERNLSLTLQLLQKNKPTVVCLNFWDETAHRGISIDAPALERLLGVPVVPVSALSGEGIKDLVESIGRARPPIARVEPGDPWKQIGRIVDRVQRLSHRHHTFPEFLADLTLHPVWGLAAAAVILSTTFAAVRLMGEGLVNGVCDPLFVRAYYPLVRSWAGALPWPWLAEILVGHTADPLQSFGIFSTGVYIAMVLVFPYFISFYLLLGILEDSGYLPRLAVVLDTFLHRLGLHGYSSIPVMLGLGCKVPALMATRVLDNRREKVLTTALILMSAPCLPQSAMVLSLGMHYGALTVIAIFAIIFAVSLSLNAVLNRVVPGESSELFMEIPHYRLPSAKLLARKLWLRIADYVREILPMIAAGVLIINVLTSIGLIDAVTRLLGAPLAYLLGLPHDIAPVMILGFLRKDVSIALLAPFGLSASQFIVAAIFMVLYVPCVASFFTLLRELGLVSTAKIVGLGLLTATLVTAALHWMFVALSLIRFSH